MSARYILVEGYDDRAFVAGFLLYRMSCQMDAGLVKTAMPKAHAAGTYAYRTSSGAGVVIYPCHRDVGAAMPSVPGAASTPVGQETKDIAEVIVSTRPPDEPADIVLLINDSDEHAVNDAATGAANAPRLTKHGLFRAPARAGFSLSGDARWLGNGSTRLGGFLWYTTAATAPGVPVQQTLERIVCAALSEVYPGCAAAVSSWLASRGTSGPPGVTDSSHKPHAWSWYAGGYASEHGTGHFYAALWKDPVLVPVLERRLSECGALDYLRAVGA